MKNLVPYVNLETLKDSNGRIEAFLVRAAVNLPADSTPKHNGDGAIADNVLYRPLTISYNGTSSETKLFHFEFIIKRDEVGLLERGAKVNVKNGMQREGASLRGIEGTGGIAFDYEDIED
ncbi:hypothetical protein DMA11_05775 [Marinilabiliaceae bacterium JC017]|nr:hypothetical protein DMA11_05775 [Marinilabiliaceae bacterium JC017]